MGIRIKSENDLEKFKIDADTIINGFIKLINEYLIKYMYRINLNIFNK